MKIERTDKYRVHSYDSDMNGRLNLPDLSKFLQETAWLNAEDMGLGYSQFRKENIAWVLFKQYIEIDELPEWGDDIEIRTWPSESDRLFCYREFEISKGGKISGRVSSSWLVINLQTRKPLRTSMYYQQDYNLNGEILFPEMIKRKMRWRVEEGISKSQRVELTDIDVNDHVNNSRYLQWCLNSYEMSYYRKHQIKSIEQQFLSEAILGDELEIKSINVSEGRNQHRIERAGKDLYLLELNWD